MTHLTLDEKTTLRVQSGQPGPAYRALCNRFVMQHEWSMRPLAGVNGEHPECERCGILALGTAGPLYLLYRKDRRMEGDGDI